MLCVGTLRVPCRGRLAFLHPRPANVIGVVVVHTCAFVSDEAAAAHGFAVGQSRTWWVAEASEVLHTACLFWGMSPFSAFVVFVFFCCATF